MDTSGPLQPETRSKRTDILGAREVDRIAQRLREPSAIQPPGPFGSRIDEVDTCRLAFTAKQLSEELAAQDVASECLQQLVEDRERCIRNMIEHCGELVRVLDVDTAGDDDEFSDDESVGWRGDGTELEMTFGHVRGVRRALAAAKDLLDG